MGRIVMPKNSALLEEITSVLKIYYENKGWLSNDKYKDELKKLIGDDQYSSSYTKKGQITSYFGFTTWQDISNPRSDRKITDLGIKFYESLLDNNQSKILDVLLESIKSNTFGRECVGCSSDSDIEPPQLFIKLCLILDYLTKKEFAYALWQMDEYAVDFDVIISELKSNRLGIHELDFANIPNIYTDPKPIVALTNWGFFIKEDEKFQGSEKIVLNKYILEKHIKEITNLPIKNNSEIKLVDEDFEQNTYINIEDKFFRRVAYNTFLMLLENFGEEKVLEGYEEKVSSAGNKVFHAITLPQYFGSENFIGQFESEENYKDIDSKKTKRFVPNGLSILGNDYSYFTSQWNANENGRPLTLNNFNKYLSDITEGKYIIVKEDNKYKLKIEGKTRIEEVIDFNNFNKIYFGPPGTGKSHAIKEELKKLGAKGDKYSRVTFHPDYDYHSFVGGYKPFTDTEDDDKIKYKFVPQVFTDLYVKAWSNTSEDYYLVIEEINRGNCAEIFGDIFQLLDRNPEYNIEPSSELKAYLKEQENDLNKDITDEDAKVKLLFDGKLQMPNNLSILASMNTSDQSLYPMDSAFKRRWDWHYVPIDLKCTESNFTINIDDIHQYSWLEFLAKVNDKIYSVTKSEDKQIGNWFINASKSENIISKELFINKVLFYLWNDVFKDEVFNPDNIFIERNTDGTKNRDISFNNFYNKDEQDRLLIHLLSDILNVPLIKSEDKEIVEYSQENQEVNVAAEFNAEVTKENKSESEE